MTFRIGWQREGKLERCLYMQKSGILTAAALYRGKVICSCNITAKGMAYNDINETIHIPKRVAQIRLDCCFRHFHMDQIGARDIVKIVQGEFEGAIGEILVIEKTQYGQFFKVKFPGGCICPFTELQLEKIKGKEVRKLFS